MLPEEHQALIKRVLEFEIDPGDKALTFCERLARENRWNVEYANRVILEYKRFCILAMLAGHPVTPSEEVDQAWHLHLTYTNSYWKRFCEQTLGQPLHHGPTEGGSTETAKFKDWYAKTLESYEKIFSQKPPSDIWPNVNQRFSKASNWRWVNDQDALIIEKRQLLFMFSITSIFVLTVIAFIYKTPTRKVFPFNLDSSSFLIFYLALGGLLVVATRMLKTAKSKKRPNPDIDRLNLDNNQLAWLSGGAGRVLELSVFRLMKGDHVRPIKRWLTRKLEVTGNRVNSGGLEQDLYDAIQQNVAMKQLDRVASPYVRPLEHELRSLGLLTERGFIKFTWIAIAVLTSILAVRIYQTVDNDRPVLFLLIEFAILLFGLLAINVNSPPSTVTVFLHKHREKAWDASTKKLDPHDIADVERSFALIGPKALQNKPEFASMLPLLAVLPGASRLTGSGDGSGGGGCGGGGCGGGGCGGCGGCGG